MTMKWADMYTGEVHAVYLFVAVLPYSQYTFVKPAESMALEAWVACNVAALRFFGGAGHACELRITRDLPLNLKAGITSHTPDEAAPNRTFQEFGDYYGPAVIPTGAAKPKCKPGVAGNVGEIGGRIVPMSRKVSPRFATLH